MKLIFLPRRYSRTLFTASYPFVFLKHIKNTSKSNKYLTRSVFQQNADHLTLPGKLLKNRPNGIINRFLAHVVNSKLCPVKIASGGSTTVITGNCLPFSGSEVSSVKVIFEYSKLLPRPPSGWRLPNGIGPQTCSYGWLLLTSTAPLLCSLLCSPYATTSSLSFRRGVPIWFRCGQVNELTECVAQEVGYYYGDESEMGRGDGEERFIA